MSTNDTKTILLVEDEAIIAMAEKMSLEKYGYSVITVTTGEKAVETVTSNPEIDLILIDIDLGFGIDGTQAAEQILSHKDIPVVFLSSHIEPEIVEKTEKITSYGYVVKNSRVVVLDASIKMALKLFNEKMERKQAEEKLKESEDRLTKTMIAANDGMWDWDLKTNEVYFDPRYYEMAGYQKDEFSHNLEEFQNRLHPEDVDYVMNEAQKHLEGKRDRFIVEFRFKKKNGDWMWIMGRGKIVERDDQSNPIRFIGIHTDITERKLMEKELQAEKENLRVTLNSIGDAVISTNIQGKVVHMNPVAEELCGWTLAQAKGKQLSEVFNIINSETREKAANPVKKVLENGKIIGLANHTVLVSRNGKEYQIADSAAPIKNIDGDITGVVLTFSNVTEKYLAQKQIAESEAKFRSIVENASAVIFTIDKEGKFLLSEGKSLETLGLKPGQVVGMSAFELYKDYHAIIKGIKEALAGRTFKDVIQVDDIYFDVFCTPNKDDSGNLKSITGMAIDITERKQAEEELRKSETFRSQLFNSSHLPIVVMEADTFRYIDCNPAAIEIYGYTSKEHVLGLTPLDVSAPFQYDDSASSEKALFYIEKAKTEGSVVFEWKHQRPDGTVWDAEVHLLNFSVGDRVLLQFTLVDITERKQAEDKIKEQLAEKETFLREVHHRMKNNMANVESLLSLQADETDNPVAKAAIQESLTHVQSIRVLYDKLLLGKDYHDISVKSYVEGLLDSISAVFVMENEITIQKQITDFTIDSKKAVSLGIIINELLTNVFKYAFEGCENSNVSLSIERSENNVTLIIQDNGIGIDERTTVNKSSGLGLTLVKMLVEQLDGTYSSVNENGTKSTVQFEI